MAKLPEYCEGCARRINNKKCSGWKDYTGCSGEQWATTEQVEREEAERQAYADEYGGKIASLVQVSKIKSVI